MALQQPITAALATTIGVTALLTGCCSVTDIAHINMYDICGRNWLSCVESLQLSYVLDTECEHHSK